MLSCIESSHLTESNRAYQDLEVLYRQAGAESARAKVRPKAVALVHFNAV